MFSQGERKDSRVSFPRMILGDTKRHVGETLNELYPRVFFARTHLKVAKSYIESDNLKENVQNLKIGKRVYVCVFCYSVPLPFLCIVFFLFGFCSIFFSEPLRAL